MEKILSVRDMRVTFHARRSQIKAVRGVSFDVYDRDLLAIVGESGSGKSVLMKSVMGILPDNADVSARELSFMGNDLLDLPAEERRMMRGRDLAMIFQDPMTSLDPLRTIGYHLAEVLGRHRGLGGDAARQEAVRALALVGIPDPERRLDEYPHEFSGGMRQRVLIAMALCCAPKLLIADEPTTALDVTIQAQILDLLRALRDDEGMSVVLITHDLGVVASLCNRIEVMYGGLVMEEGLTDEMFYTARHPYTRALLRAVPRPQTNKHERLQSIPGLAPSLVDPPEGCPFAGRCSFTCERCSQAIPPWRAYSATQRARCIFSSDELDAMSEGGRA